ncbi:unnamed protein product [Rotaria sp. Silwood1]|nr:unnamed protein product [Rotaria sp. Silwood1]
MGSGFNDLIGIEAAGEKFADALKEAQANATVELRNVALTAINYVKSFTPVIIVVEVEARLRVSSLPLAFRLRPRLFKAFPHGLYNIINT